MAKSIGTQVIVSQFLFGECIKQLKSGPWFARQVGGGVGGGGHALPYKQRGEPCQQISNEPLKGTNMGVAQAELYS